MTNSEFMIRIYCCGMVLANSDAIENKQYKRIRPSIMNLVRKGFIPLEVDWGSVDFVSKDEFLEIVNSMIDYDLSTDEVASIRIIQELLSN